MTCTEAILIYLSLISEGKEREAANARKQAHKFFVYRGNMACACVLKTASALSELQFSSSARQTVVLPDFKTFT